MTSIGWKTVGLCLLLHIGFQAQVGGDRLGSTTTVGRHPHELSTSCDTKRENLLMKFAQFRRSHPDFTKVEMDERRAMLEEELKGLACTDEPENASI
eukprot:42249-Pyramimonas_sp.AAC.2